MYKINKTKLLAFFLIGIFSKTTIDDLGAKRITYASGNYLCLAPGEEKQLKMKLFFREDITGKKIEVKAGAWNAKAVKVQLQNN